MGVLARLAWNTEKLLMPIIKGLSLPARVLGIRARGSASRPQRIPNAIPSMVLDGVDTKL